MKSRRGVIAAVLAFCCALLIGSSSPARAQECTTQGALARALANVLGISHTTAQEAANALAGRNIKPLAGWDVNACLDDVVVQQVREAFGDARFEGVLVTIGYKRDSTLPGGTPVVSPHRP